MPHTTSRFQQDLGFADAYFIVGSPDAHVTGSPGTVTRNGVGDISLNWGASVSPIIDFNMFDGQLIRIAPINDYQEQFGGSQAGGPGGWPQPYRPDVIGSMNTGQQIQPRTTAWKKGLKLVAIQMAYLITGAALTTHTCRLDKSIFANNVAIATTNLLASAANGLQTATQANPYVTTITGLAPSTMVYYNTDLTQLWFEIAPVIPASAAYRLYWVKFAVEFNFN